MGRTQTHLQLIIDFIATGAESNTDYFLDYLSRKSSTVKIFLTLFLAQAWAAARRKLKSEEPLKTIDMLYKGRQ